MSGPGGHVRVIVFPGVQDMPNFAAEAQGFFTRRNLAVETVITSGSKELRAGLAGGGYQIVHGAVDNAIDMIRVGGHDVVTVCCLDHGFSRFFVQPDIHSFADLGGRTIVVDAPDTAFALMIYEILRRHGVERSEYTVKSVGSTRFRLEAMQRGHEAAACMLNLPFAVLAERSGLRVLADPILALGAYQSCWGFVLRAWAECHADVLTRYLAAYLEGLRWVLTPGNRAGCVQLLGVRLKIAPDVAETCLDIVTDPVGGFARDAVIDMEGFRRPASTMGKADSSSTWRNRWQRDAPIDRDAVRRIGSTPANPVIVPRAIGKKLIVLPRAILEPEPRPKNRVNSGKNKMASAAASAKAMAISDRVISSGPMPSDLRISSCSSVWNSLRKSEKRGEVTKPGRRGCASAISISHPS